MFLAEKLKGRCLVSHRLKLEFGVQMLLFTSIFVIRYSYSLPPDYPTVPIPPSHLSHFPDPSKPQPDLLPNLFHTDSINALPGAPLEMIVPVLSIQITSFSR